MILFDFDGVLLDSIREAAVTAYIASTDQLVTSIEELPPAATQLFLRNRFHFQPAGDAILLMSWCLKEPDPDRILTAAEFQMVLEQGKDSPVRERTRHFFRARESFIAKDRDRWIELNAPYQPLWRELIRWGPERITVLTNKNRSAVLELTHHFGLRLERENVYGGDDGVTKAENLERIVERFDRTDYCFVDDSLGNLVELDEYAKSREIKLRMALAEWGYVGHNDAERALKHGFSVWSQNDLLKELEQ